jgi:hypothetical protein
MARSTSLVLALALTITLTGCGSASRRSEPSLGDMIQTRMDTRFKGGDWQSDHASLRLLVSRYAELVGRRAGNYECGDIKTNMLKVGLATELESQSAPPHALAEIDAAYEQGRRDERRRSCKIVRMHELDTEMKMAHSAMTSQFCQMSIEYGGGWEPGPLNKAAYRDPLKSIDSCIKGRSK